MIIIIVYIAFYTLYKLSQANINTNFIFTYLSAPQRTQYCLNFNLLTWKSLRKIGHLLKRCEPFWRGNTLVATMLHVFAIQCTIGL